MGKLLAFKRPISTHTCFIPRRVWGGGNVVADKACPICKAKKLKRKRYLVQSRCRARQRKSVTVD